VQRLRGFGRGDKDTISLSSCHGIGEETSQGPTHASQQHSKLQETFASKYTFKLPKEKFQRFKLSFIKIISMQVSKNISDEVKNNS
jgi:hypothetical protein